MQGCHRYHYDLKFAQSQISSEFRIELEIMRLIGNRSLLNEVKIIRMTLGSAEYLYLFHTESCIIGSFKLEQSCKSGT